MQPTSERYKLIHGDSQLILPTLTGIHAICCDPPYGCKNDCDYTRFSGGTNGPRKEGAKFKPIKNDDRPFDPTPLLAYKKVALFGYQYFAKHLPTGTILVWKKKRDHQLGTFLSDGELIWLNFGKGLYIFEHIWNGFDRQTERNQKTLHPTQKPIKVCEAIISRMKLPPDSLICDPYMGTGSTGIAALNLGHRFIGIELDQGYYDIAKERINKLTKGE